MRLLDDPDLQTILIIGFALAMTPALVLVVVLGLALLIDNPPLTVSELILFEAEALILWVGVLAVALYIYYRRKRR